MYIYKTTSNKYVIRQKHQYYGTYNTHEEATKKLQQLIHEQKIKPKTKDPQRYISIKYTGPYTKKYRIRKTINGKEIHKTFNTLEEAIQYRDYMESINWGQPPTHTQKTRSKTRYTGIRYIIQKTNGKYVLQRRGVHYGTYNTIIDAVKEKLFWENINWDIEQIDNH